MARMLIIDDDAYTRYAVRQFLECAGHTVIEAADGKAGMCLFRQGLPDVVITDIFMPEQDGLEIILALKREYPSVKIIAISGGGDMGDLQYLGMSRVFGAERVLCKPFTQQELLTTIQEISNSCYAADSIR